MHAVGQVFPRGDRSPAIEPVGERRLAAALGAELAADGLTVGRSLRVSSGFYISQVLEVARP
jgi:magnesium-protoporphyrin O-methyltransferase